MAPESEMPMETLLSQANANMYRVKQARGAADLKVIPRYRAARPRTAASTSASPAAALMHGCAVRAENVHGVKRVYGKKTARIGCASTEVRNPPEAGQPLTPLQ